MGTSQKRQQPVVIWRLIDNKAGHQNQSLGLTNALAMKIACDTYTIDITDHPLPWRSFFYKYWPHPKALPTPDLVIGAGRKTHSHLLAVKYCFAAKAIVLMRPSLPLCCFDMALIPQHDGCFKQNNVVMTQGALNPIRPSNQHQPQYSLILLGGPSKHFQWNSKSIVAQLKTLIVANPDHYYHITTSRRTPTELTPLLHSLSANRVEITPFEATTPEWLQQQLANAGQCWVTEDSVSMIYEALTAQTAVGLLNLKIIKSNRLSRGITTLIEQGLVRRFNHHQPTQQPKVTKQFTEADRCADIVVKKWFES